MINNINKQKLITYLLVGGTSYIIEMGSLYLFNVVFGLPGVVAVSISFWIGFIVAFVLQKLITFKNHEKAKHIVAKQLIAYSILAAWNYVFTLGTVALLSSVISVFIIRTATIGIITMWNFLIYNKIFKDNATKPIEL